MNKSKTPTTKLNVIQSGLINSKFIKLLIKTFLFVIAVIMAFGLLTYLSPTIAHAAPNPATTTTANKASKPLDVCTTIGGCLSGIEKYQSTATTVDGSVAGLVKLLFTVIEYMIYFSYFIALIFLIVSGYKMMDAQGDGKKYGDAQTMFVNTIYGLIAVICSQTVVFLIQSVLTNFKIV